MTTRIDAQRNAVHVTIYGEGRSSFAGGPYMLIGCSRGSFDFCLAEARDLHRMLGLALDAFDQLQEEEAAK